MASITIFSSRVFAALFTAGKEKIKNLLNIRVF